MKCAECGIEIEVGIEKDTGNPKEWKVVCPKCAEGEAGKMLAEIYGKAGKK